MVILGQTLIAEWKCWWGDVREVFVIAEARPVGNRLSVTVHAEYVGAHGRVVMVTS